MAGCLLEAESAVLDGEIVFLGNDGRPEFPSLMRRRKPLCFYAFDILWPNGKDLRKLPLTERKAILRRVVPKVPAPVLYVDHFEERGVGLFRAVCGADLEGIVAKRKDGLYVPGERSWIKIKNPGYSQAGGGGNFLNGGGGELERNSRPLLGNGLSERWCADRQLFMIETG